MIRKPTGMRDSFALEGTECELAVMRPERAANVSVRQDGVHVVAEDTFSIDECAELASMLLTACDQYREFTATHQPSDATDTKEVK